MLLKEFTPAELNNYFPVRNLGLRLNQIFEQIDGYLENGGAKARGTVTQTTSATTAVTINFSAGVITTVSQTLAASSSETFTVNDNLVTATSIITLGLDASGSTTGLPIVQLGGAPGTGSFTIKIINLSSSGALNGPLNIYFNIA